MSLSGDNVRWCWTCRRYYAGLICGQCGRIGVLRRTSTEKAK